MWFDASKLLRVADLPVLAALFFGSVLAYGVSPLFFTSLPDLVFHLGFSLAGLTLVLVLTYGAVRALGSKSSPPWFFAPVLQALCVSLWFGVAVRFAALVVDFALGSHRVAEVVFSLTPFYVFALFGWVVDQSSQMRDWRALAAGCVAVVLFALMVLVFDFRFGSYPGF